MQSETINRGFFPQKVWQVFRSFGKSKFATAVRLLFQLVFAQRVSLETTLGSKMELSRRQMDIVILLYIMSVIQTGTRHDTATHTAVTTLLLYKRSAMIYVGKGVRVGVREKPTGSETPMPTRLVHTPQRFTPAGRGDILPWSTKYGSCHQSVSSCCLKITKQARIGCTRYGRLLYTYRQFFIAYMSPVGLIRIEVTVDRRI